MEPTRPSSSWIRNKDVQGKSATFPELFFDLVFVFALIQLSQTLADDFSSTIAAESVLLILAIWWVWIYTAWTTNLLDAERVPVRLMLFALMFLGVLIALALPDAFGDHGMAFAITYSAMQVGRSLFTLYAFRGVDRASYLTFCRITLWLVLSSLFWIAGGLADAPARAGFWSVALLIEYVSPVAGYFIPGLGRSPRETLNVSGEHMAERAGLFVIICLGETILATGRNASEHMTLDLTFLVFCSAFASTVAMWWIYFHHGQKKAADEAEATSAPESVALNLFTYAHLPIVAGIILTAVGEEFSLGHANEGSSLKHAIAILGGPVLFLLGNLWVKMAATRALPLSHFGGIALIAAGALLVPVAPNYVLTLIATGGLLVTAVWEYIALERASSSTA